MFKIFPYNIWNFTKYEETLKYISTEVFKNLWLFFLWLVFISSEKKNFTKIWEQPWTRVSMTHFNIYLPQSGPHLSCTLCRSAACDLPMTETVSAWNVGQSILCRPWRQTWEACHHWWCIPGYRRCYFLWSTSSSLISS